MSITIFENIQSELRVDPVTGIGYCSIRGAARIAGVDQNGLARNFRGEDLEPSKLAESLMDKGFKGEDLALFAQTGIPDLALAGILEYYAIDAGRYCNPTARAAYKTFASIGIRTVIQNVCKHEASLPASIALPSVDPIDAVNALAVSLKFFDIDISNPRFKQGLQDIVLNKLGIAQLSLPGSVTVYLGVAEKAQELGYPIGLVTQFRSQLGKYVASIGLPSQKEKRLCNGTQRPINVYLDSPELSVAVCEFMDAKTLATANGGSI